MNSRRQIAAGTLAVLLIFLVAAAAGYEIQRFGVHGGPRMTSESQISGLQLTASVIPPAGITLSSSGATIDLTGSLWSVASVQPIGACCLAGDTCAETTQAGCTDGIWQGPLTRCTPNPCPAPIGACCDPNGTCTETTQAACNGVWQGPSTTCTPNLCPRPAGACCFEYYGTCWELTQAVCQAGGGRYRGDWTTCTPHRCACRGDANCDGVVNFADINPFVAALGGAPPCAFDNCDVNGDGQINFADINPFVAALGTGGQCP